MKSLFLSFLPLLFAGVIHGQEKSPRFFETIEDNSFFIEEAYNQEAGIVQHIFNVVYGLQSPKDLSFSFTQEWPVFTQTHQLSYTVPAAFPEEGGNGLGDVLLNYRYQLFDQDDWAAVAPRLSVVLPTGNNDRGIGFGAAGVQINFPASKRWSNHFVAHVNAGGTFLPGVQRTLPSGAEAERTLIFANAGVSLGWLVTRRLNLMLEYLSNFLSEIDGLGGVNRFHELTLNPLIRGSIDIGKLQIVPGIGVPLTWSQGDFQPGIFFYLSLEHPFHETTGR